MCLCSHCTMAKIKRKLKIRKFESDKRLHSSAHKGIFVDKNVQIKYHANKTERERGRENFFLD